MRKNYLLVFALLFFTNQLPFLTAQSRIPTLQTQLRLPNADSTQLYYELGKEYSDVHVDSCFYFLKTSLVIAERRNNAVGMAQAMNRIGHTYIFYKREDGKAVEWLNKAIAIAKPTNDNLNLARSYQYLGTIARFQKSNNGEELLARSVTYAIAAKDWEVLTLSYDCLAAHYLSQKKYKEAEMALLNAMNTCEPYSPDYWLSCGLSYVDILITQNRKEEAAAFCLKLEPVKYKLQKKKGEFIYYMDLTILEIKLKHFVTADSLLQKAKAIELAKAKPDTFHLTIIYRVLLELNITKGDSDKTYQTIEDIIDIRVATKASRLTQDSKVKMTELKSALELEQKQSEIDLLDVQKRQQWFLVLGIGLIALLLAGFTILLRRNQKRIEQQKTELSALNATKDKLFALLSHDLMSPVATLKNYMMLVDFGAMNQTEFVDTTQNLKRHVNNVYGMLENVLHWAISQMRDTKPMFEEVSLSDVVHEQIMLIEPIAKGKNIVIQQTIPTDLILKIDKNHLALIIRNLLQNALKFTNSGGSIVFNSEITEGGKKTMSIRDNGIGMSNEIKQQLFQINKNTHRSGTSAEKGTGLGLILTKELVELNGGAIDVQSEVGKGTTFSMVF